MVSLEGARLESRCVGYFEAICEVANACSVGCCVGDDNDLVAPVNESLRELVDVRLDTPRLRVEEVRHKPAPQINTVHTTEESEKGSQYAILSGIGSRWARDYGLQTGIGGGYGRNMLSHKRSDGEY